MIRSELKMYNVLIADDEPSVCEGLEIIIDWSQYGFRIVNTAKNGRDALEKIKNDRYNLLITDIRMPVLDGIELIKAIRIENPNIRILVISGYSDFSYAKKSMEYGVKGYILKPIDADELIESIVKIKEELDSELKNKLFAKENIKIVKDKFLYDFANSSLSSKEIRENEHICSLVIPDKLFGIALIEIDNFFDLLEKGVEEAKLTMFSVRNIVEEIFENKGFGLVYQDTQAVLGLLFFGDRSELVFESIREKLEHISMCIFNYLKIKVTIGYGGIAENYHVIKKVRKKAQLAIERRIVAQESSVVDYEQVATDENQIPVILWDSKELLLAVESEHFETIEKEIDILISELIKQCVSMDVVKAVLYNVLFGLLKIIKTYNGDGSVIFSENDKNDFRHGNVNINQISDWLTSVCTRTYTYVADLKKCKSENVISHVIRYINNNYHEDLSLKFIAGVFYMNPVYLGRLFKNTIGETFNDYLNKVRMSEVKKIISQGDYKMLEVIERVGYKNAEYFYKIFKRYEEISFKEYKDILK